MAKKKKYYVVWSGNTPGIYDSWTDCQLQIKGYPNARYKSFKSKEEAIEAYGSAAADFIGQGTKKKVLTAAEKAQYGEPILESISVDAACSGNPGLMEYQGVYTKTKEVLFHKGPFKKGTNNVGEFLALVHGLAFLKQQGKNMPIYSDSKIAMGWVQRKVFRSKLEKSHINKDIFLLVDRALVWLHNNTWEIPVLKWETKVWGEIPADFGRK